MFFCSICETTCENIDVAIKCCMDKLKYDELIEEQFHAI